MGQIISAIFGDNGASALKAQIAQQQALQQSDQGTQLASLSKQQAATDNEAATLNKPGLGRAMLSFQKNQTGGPAATLGG